MKSILIGILLLFFLTNLVSGQQPNAAATSHDTQSPAHKYFTDTILINQNGEKMRFYTDLLQGKTVIIDTFFSTCKTACLPMTQNLKRIQETLGERLGKDVYILSVTVDSEMDTPAQLKAFADKFHARSGWYFLTGTKENVDFVLRKLGQYVDNKQDHLTVFIIGNERTGLWKKAYGLATSDELIKVVDSVLNDKPAQD